jgi:hypothetical protein
VDLGGSPWESMGIHGSLRKPRRSSGSPGNPGAPWGSQGLPGAPQRAPEGPNLGNAHFPEIKSLNRNSGRFGWELLESMGIHANLSEPRGSQGLPRAPQGAPERPNLGNLHFPELGPSTEILVDLGGSLWESMGITGNLWEPRRSSGSPGAQGLPRPHGGSEELRKGHLRDLI